MSYLGISLIRRDHQEFVHSVLIEKMSLVMSFLGFHHFFVRCHTGHIPYLLGSFEGWFVQEIFIKDMSHCYNIF